MYGADLRMTTRRSYGLRQRASSQFFEKRVGGQEGGVSEGWLRDRLVIDQFGF